MPRKATGGHNPLTYHERSKLEYGTTTARLNTESQRRFGDCCLSLTPAADPVATPSGHIYDRESIVAYLLSKTKELKKEKEKYDAEIERRKKEEDKSLETSKKKRIREFVLKDQGALQRKDVHSDVMEKKKGRAINTESRETGKNTLKRTSYWLSEFQPEENDSSKTSLAPPPNRCPSPITKNPLRLKDLIPLVLNRENPTESKDNRNNLCICCVSKKAITTQPSIVIKKTGQVMLKDVYEDIVRPSKVCPVTGKKFKSENVLELQKAASGFASSGQVVAKKYKHTLT